MSAHANSRVAVLMLAYNAGETINRAVNSIVCGTFPCDIFIVDDGSQTPVAEVLKPYPRINIIRLDTNSGIPRAGNVGFREILARGYEYIACLMADDISHPDRIASQVEFLDHHPAVAVVGTWGRSFDAVTGRPLRIGRMPVSPQAVRRGMRFNSAVINTSTMIRASALHAVGLYSERYAVAEDYELYRRIGERFDIANLPRVLTAISISADGVSLRRRRRQLANRLAIQWKYFEPLKVGAWLGIAKTLLLFVIPVSVLSRLKTFMRNARKAGPWIDGEPPLDGKVGQILNGTL